MSPLQILTLLLVFFVPLYPLQLDTRIIFAIAIFALVLYRVFVKNFSEDLKAKKPVTIFFLLFLLALAASTVFSIDRERSLFTLLLYFSCFVIFTSIRSIFPTQKSQLFIVYCLLFTVSILSLISLYNTLILKQFTLEPEGLSFMWIYFGHNHIANLHLFAIPLSFYLLLTTKDKWLKILSIFLVILFSASLFLSLARSGILAFFIASFATILFFPKTFKNSRKALAILALLFVASILVFGPLAKMGDFTINKPRVKITENTSRIIYWKQAMSNFEKHPVFGTGPDTFHIVNKMEPTPIRTISADNPHNYFLQQLSDNGIFGLATFLPLTFLVFKRAFKTVKSKLPTKEGYLYLALLSAMAGSAIISMIDPGWRIPYVFFLFWLLAGLF